MQKLTLIVLLAFSLPVVLPADETTRQIQEELRRRHLFFNEIDGRNTSDLAIALRKYQERQGFPTTGRPDPVTMQSLGIASEPLPPGEGADALPDEPVLRSDAAPGDVAARPQLPPPQLNRKALPITKSEATEFVRRYIAACESPSIHDELSLYADRVDYFDHGIVDRQYVQNELAVYDQHWPSRSYRIINGVRLTKAGANPTAKFRLAFKVASIPTNRRASGRTDEALGLGRRADGAIEIVSIREQRVRRTSRSRRRGVNSDPIRSVRRVFRNIFHH